MKKKNILIALIVITAITLIGIMIGSYGTSASQRISNKPNQIYVWQSGAMIIKGEIDPANCGLESKNCKCKLSDKHNSCTLNINIKDINYAAKIQISPNVLNSQSIKYTLGDGCQNHNLKDKYIENCSISFTWDKTNNAEENAQIELIGNEGTQSLINLHLEANK